MDDLQDIIPTRVFKIVSNHYAVVDWQVGGDEDCEHLEEGDRHSF